MDRGFHMLNCQRVFVGLSGLVEGKQYRTNMEFPANYLGFLQDPARFRTISLFPIENLAGSKYCKNREIRIFMCKNMITKIELFVPQNLRVYELETCSFYFTDDFCNAST